MEKTIVILVALMLVFCTVAGCTTTKPDTPTTESATATPISSAIATAVDPITIKYYDWDTVDGSVIDAFMAENPDIIVEVYDVSANSDRTTQLDILAMSGDIDVMPIADGDQFTRFEQGMMANLDELIAQYGIDMDASFGDYASWAKMDGSYYAVPYRTSRTALYYNKNIYDAAGVA